MKMVIIHQILKKRSIQITAVCIALLLAFSYIVPLYAAQQNKQEKNGPPLSQTAEFSGFAKANAIYSGSEFDIANLASEPPNGPSLLPTGVVNNDFNKRPQNEPAIALNPDNPSNFVVGANDYGIGAPIGSGTYPTFNGGQTFTDYFPPFALLAAQGSTSQSQQLILEPPIGTGDPSFAFGKTRSAGPIPAGLPVVYKASLGFSASFCENGVFVYRSLDGGKSWTRPVVPDLAPPKGLFTVVYWDKANDCTIFHDKPWIAVDNTGGPHNGRVYVTWTMFKFSKGHYIESPIMMAYSDDNGRTFSDPIEISGFSLQYCPAQVNGPPGPCDEDQFSSPVVASDGTLIVAFENEQFHGAADGFRDQYLVVKVNPDTFQVSGPFKVDPGTDEGVMIDGANDYPINTDGRQTLCNSNFRVNSAGNLAIGPAGTGGAPDGVQPLYVVWSDNREHAGEFPFPTFISTTSSPKYQCPQGKSTDTTVFLAKSTDGGQTWEFVGPVSSTSHDHWFPWAAVAPNGRLDVVYYDRTADPNNRLANTVLARSSDGGSTFTYTTVSSFASDFTLAFFGSGRFIGDYNNLAIDSNGNTYSVWTGFTPGRDTDIYFAKTPP